MTDLTHSLVGRIRHQRSVRVAAGDAFAPWSGACMEPTQRTVPIGELARGAQHHQGLAVADRRELRGQATPPIRAVSTKS